MFSWWKWMVEMVEVVEGLRLLSVENVENVEMLRVESGNSWPSTLNILNPSTKKISLFPLSVRNVRLQGYRKVRGRRR